MNRANPIDSAWWKFRVSLGVISDLWRKGTVVTLPEGFGEAFVRGTEDRLIARERKIKNIISEHPYAHRAAKAVAEPITALPFVFRRGEEDGAEVTSGPAVDLFRRPNQFDSACDIWEKTILSMLQNDHGVLWLTPHLTENPGASSFPVAIHVKDAAEWEMVATEGGVGWKRKDGKGRMWGPLETVWFRFPDPWKPSMSLTPFRALSRALTSDVEAGRFNLEFFRNGARAGMLVTAEDRFVDDTLAQDIEEKLNKKISGTGRRFRTLVLGGGKFNVQDMSASHRDMEFIEQMRFNREDTRAALGEGPLFFGDVTDGNRANTDGQERVMWRNVLLPMRRRLQSVLQSQFLAKFAATRDLVGVFNTSGVEALQADMETEAAVGERLYKLGFTPNEINERFGWGFDSKPERDVVLVAATMIPLEDAIDGGMGSADATHAPEPGEQDGSERGAAPENRKDAARLERWRALEKRKAPFERKMRAQVARFFLELRSGVLRRLNQFKAPGIADLNQVVFNHGKEGARLAATVEAVLKGAVDKAITDALLEISDTSPSSDFAEQADRIINSRMGLISGVPKTLHERLTASLVEGVEAGEDTKQLAARVRDVFKRSARRAQLVARNEISFAFTNARVAAFTEQGVTKIEWLSAGDDDVRETHTANDGVARTIGEAFPNGLRWPQDETGPPSETILCRCAVLPGDEEIA